METNQEIRYVCTGGCGAVITEEEYKGGLTKCGTRDCPHYGELFEKRMYCPEDGELYMPGEEHEHKK